MNRKRAEALLPLLRGVIIGVPPRAVTRFAAAAKKIREHSDTFLHSDEEILLYAPHRLRRNEKARRQG